MSFGHCIWYFSAEIKKGIRSWFEDKSIKVSPFSKSKECTMGPGISGECSKTCGGGIRNATRKVISGEPDCDQVMKTETCNDIECHLGD